MKYLTLEQAFRIHDAVEQKTGTIRDLGALQSALARPKTTVLGEDAYPDIYNKAAALMHSLVKNHCFENGNKRTALIATVTFMALNKHLLALIDVNSAVEFLDNVATGEYDLEAIAEHLRAHTMRIDAKVIKDKTFEETLGITMDTYKKVVKELATR